MVTVVILLRSIARFTQVATAAVSVVTVFHTAVVEGLASVLAVVLVVVVVSVASTVASVVSVVASVVMVAGTKLT